MCACGKFSKCLGLYIVHGGSTFQPFKHPRHSTYYPSSLLKISTLGISIHCHKEVPNSPQSLKNGTLKKWMGFPKIGICYCFWCHFQMNHVKLWGGSIYEYSYSPASLRHLQRSKVQVHLPLRPQVFWDR